MQVCKNCKDKRVHGSWAGEKDCDANGNPVPGGTGGCGDLHEWEEVKVRKKIYFGFGLADGMFPENCAATKKTVSPEEAVKVLSSGNVVSCLNPSHALMVGVLKERYREVADLVEIPEKAPVVRLEPGDSLVVLGVRGLPRLENRHEYTRGEIAKAIFSLSLWEVI